MGPVARHDPDERRARRAFIRAQHPDVGGDPEHFIAGLRAWDHPPPSNYPAGQTRPARVHIIPDLPWSRRLARALLRRGGQRHRPPRVH